MSSIAEGYRLLGVPEARVDGQLVDVGHARQQSVLVVLLIEADKPVSADQLMDRVWGDDLPVRGRATLHSYLSRLRRALVSAGGAGIVRRRGGYAIPVDPMAVDLYRFHHLVEQARATDDEDRALRFMREALGLWRGEAFAGLRSPWLDDVRTTLHQHRLAVELDRADLLLRRGNHGDLVVELTARAAEHPLDERLGGQLMLSLYLSGRQADALEHYQDLRTRLIGELGLDPGADLQRLHQRIVAADPSLSPSRTAPARVVHVPRQLPRDLPTLIGRDDELDVLNGMLHGEATTAGPVVVLHGAPGVGKSALATRAAHLAASRFADGHLHVNLRGATPGVTPLSPVEALHQLLRGLGAVGSDLPADVDKAAGLLRTMVAGRRLLIVLDNAATPAQVRPLLAGCAVLVTSRTRLATVEGVTHLRVGSLAAEEASMMLDALVPDVRPAADPKAVRRLAELCGNLPLGLHVAAARLNARPSWAVSDLVERLADARHRLAELASGDTALRSSLAVSHAALRDSDDPTDRTAAKALCLFGLVPVTEIDLTLAAAMLDTSPAEADRTVERLLDAHLVEEHVPGRFLMHDLIRLFANECGLDTVSAPERSQVLTRVLGYLLATVARANALVYPHRAHHPATGDGVRFSPLGGTEEASRWLDEHRRDLIEVVRQAWLGPAEHLRLGVDLALGLHWYLHSGANDLSALVGFQQEVVAAAERLGDRGSLAVAHGNLAVTNLHVGQPDQALVHGSAELEICRELRDRFGEQRALGNLGYTHLARQRPDQAIEFLQRQLEIARDIGAAVGQAFALVNLGKAHHQLGRSAEAISMIETGLALYERMDDHYRQTDVCEVLARIHIDLGQYDRAIELMTQGLDQARRSANRFGEIWALTVLARAHRLAGNAEDAGRCAEQAVVSSDGLHGTQARTDALSEYSKSVSTT
ncbi:hypothetical protein BLA60_03440 [Actinophytocola xinjiangensis]|uniref:OmpR/PhoB-type domain-containing protein n=1 Tax=Actinophytocola xinjiangensis TaxID=485602 RepID=A0A7Z0WT02_9PSEU|nr:BTAD domain-containing putative transcriptional regulator [Actinophytocola xinjiangensis]OLF14207.1 hypothetical protein BLA60_03440 [Actinophytocola xinjiangensis]